MKKYRKNGREPPAFKFLFPFAKAFARKRKKEERKERLKHERI